MCCDSAFGAIVASRMDNRDSILGRDSKSGNASCRGETAKNAVDVNRRKRRWQNVA